MKFQIFETSYQKILKNDELETLISLKNVKCDIWSFEDVHDSVEKCEEEIKKHVEDLKSKNLVILPIICVDCEGEISEYQRI